MCINEDADSFVYAIDLYIVYMNKYVRTYKEWEKKKGVDSFMWFKYMYYKWINMYAHTKNMYTHMM